MRHNDPSSPSREHLRPWSPERVAAFIAERQDAIRAIARRKLCSSTKRVYGSEDVVSSVTARLLALAEGGRVRPRNEEEAWGLVQTAVENKSVSRNRLMSQLRHRASDYPEALDILVDRVGACESDDEATLLLLRVMSVLTDSNERGMFLLWLRGASHEVIAQQLGISVVASRQRLSASLARLRGAMAEVLD